MRVERDSAFWKREANLCVGLQLGSIAWLLVGVVFGMPSLTLWGGLACVWFGVKEFRADFFQMLMAMYEDEEEAEDGVG